MWKHAQTVGLTNMEIVSYHVCTVLERKYTEYVTNTLVSFLFKKIVDLNVKKCYCYDRVEVA